MQELVPIRPTFWNVPLWAQIGVYVLGIIVIGIVIACVVSLVRARAAGAPKDPTAKPSRKRLLRMLVEAILQPRVMKTPSGKAHIFIFWGFILLFWGTATATLDWDVGHLLLNQRFLKGNFYLAYKLILDTAGLAAFIALCWGLWRRFVSMDPKVEANYRFACILGSLALIILTGFVVEGARLAYQNPPWAQFSPVGNFFAWLFRNTTPNKLLFVHLISWIVHGLAALIFVASIPLTFFSHMFKTPTSIYWKKKAPRAAIAKIENIEEQETFGISKFEQFSNIDRIRFDGCTECGRCRSVCPAVKALTPLDPKNLVLSLQHRMHGENVDKPLIGGIVDKDALWSCTTCGACAEVCPADIPIPDLIVSMRRHLALEQGEFPEGLAGALENAGSVGNPWGMDPGSRLAWGKDLDVPTAKKGEKYEVLYWVGCSASYDKRAQRIARAMVRILKAAGVKFAVLKEERCHAEWARRAGEEYLFQTAATENIENLRKYDFERIVAACPHCFNTLKNEYPEFADGKFEVESHMHFIERLINEKRLQLKDGAGVPTVLHDACYLARWNHDAASPRALLKAAGVPLKEAVHHGEDTLCCGAGGAQVFMDRPARMNVIRLKELKATKAQEIAVSCPHCLTMLNSAQADGKSEPLVVRDIAEIVAERLPENQPSAAN